LEKSKSGSMNKFSHRGAIHLSVALAISFLTGCQDGKKQGIVAQDYGVPEILVSAKRTGRETLRDWEHTRKPEILELFREQVYGRVPGSDHEVRFYPGQALENGLDRIAKMKEVIMEVTGNGDTLRVCILILTPADADHPVPLFLGLNFDGNHTIHPDRDISLAAGWVENRPEAGITENRATEGSRGLRSGRWPVGRILQRGYGLATVYCGDFDPDFDDGFQNGIHGLMDVTPRDSSSWGTIAAWAWGLSRTMDYLETDPDIDPGRVFLIGHSRLGKAALWAGAQDERFAMVISNDSGCGGAALSRRKSGERLLDINTVFPYWFALRFHGYNGREEDLPVDQHMLLALVAPRLLYVGSAANDEWADPEGEYLSLFYAGEIYRLYGYRVFETTGLPDLNTPRTADRIAYHIRSGDHELLSFDWDRYMDFADDHFKTGP
jgi:hypothetical protein